MSSRSVGLLVLLRGGKRKFFDNVVSFSFSDSVTLTIFYSDIASDGHSISRSSDLPLSLVERMALV